jgi:hypothetical protein
MREVIFAGLLVLSHVYSFILQTVSDLTYTIKNKSDLALDLLSKSFTLIKLYQQSFFAFIVRAQRKGPIFLQDLKFSMKP